jgi:hypothetical protein
VRNLGISLAVFDSVFTRPIESELIHVYVRIVFFHEHRIAVTSGTERGYRQGIRRSSEIMGAAVRPHEIINGRSVSAVTVIAGESVFRMYVRLHSPNRRRQVLIRNVSMTADACVFLGTQGGRENKGRQRKDKHEYQWWLDRQPVKREDLTHHFSKPCGDRSSDGTIPSL